MRVLVLGAGDVGAHVARELSLEGNDVVIVDHRREALESAEESLDVLTMAGDVTQWSTLEAAEVKQAELVISVTGSDEVNVVSAALAASLGARRTVARVDAPRFYRTEAGVERGVLGIHSLLCASRLVSEELVRLIERIDATYVGNFAGNAVQVCLLPVLDGSPALGKSPDEVGLGKHIALSAVARDGLLRPVEDIVRLELDDALLLSGAPTDVVELLPELRSHRDPRRAVVVGGGDVGFQLSRLLTRSERRVQVIERDRVRCEVLAESLSKLEVIHGDGTNIACLRDEHVEGSDYIVSVTRADEVNLMVSLLAHDLGVPQAYALVHRPGYADVYAHLGIHGTAGPHDVIVRMARWLRPHRGALSSEQLTGTGHHLFEFQLGSSLERVTTVRDLGLPAESVVVGLARSMKSMPARPGTKLEPHDNLIVAAPAAAGGEIGRAMTRAGGRR